MRFTEFLALLCVLLIPHRGLCVDEFELPPIEYSTSEPHNRVSELQARIERGETKLEYKEGNGYLEDLLRELQVPADSQMLVFSKTSLQRERISPRAPRAVYFNDDVYIGYCQGGKVIEVSVADPALGAVFYSVDQEQDAPAALTRQTQRCLQCHSSSQSDGIPGHVARSVFVGPSGQPILSEGSHLVDHTTPIKDRWGGWYVTGQHGQQVHLGNFILRNRDAARQFDNKQGQNVTDLSDRITTARYLKPDSDIVALMVFEHQVLVHNLIAKALYETKRALHYQADLNRALGEPESNRLESTTRRIQNAGDKLVDALLFVDEAEITAPITGTSGFAESFAARGPRDPEGRSLRDLDLKHRLFKYPCSYLIYSSAFDALPEEMQSYVWLRLWEVLSGKDQSEKFSHLSRDDRREIRNILRHTKDNLPDYWLNGRTPPSS